MAGATTTRQEAGRRWLVLAGLVLLAVAVMAPAYRAGHPLSGNDANIHSRWAQFYAAQFWSGIGYPRWLPELNGGFGSPAFFVYPPLAHALTALLLPLAPGPESAQLRLAMSATVALAVGGIAAFAWLRALPVSVPAAALGAVAYVVMPYHLFVDTYMRTAFAELWVFAWIPVALWGLGGIATRRGFAAATLGMAGVVLTHAPTSVIIFPMFLLYVALTGPSPRVPRLLRFGLAAAIAIGLGAAYLAPAVLNLGLIDGAALVTGHFAPGAWLIGGSLHQHTPTTPAGRNDLKFLNKITLICLVQVAAWASLAWTSRDAGFAAHRRFAAVVVIVATLLTTVVAQPLWDLDTVLDRIQFPWRCLVLQCVAVPLACAIAADSRRGLAWVGAVIVGFVGFDVGAYIVTHGGARVKPAAVIFADRRDAPEYRIGDIAASAALFAPGEPSTRIVAGQGVVTVTAWRPRAIALHSEATTPLRVLVHQFAYSGWRLRIDGGLSLPTGRGPAATPVVVVDLPAGRHDATLTLIASSAERGGWWTSAAAALVFAATLVGWPTLCRRFGLASNRR